MDENGIYPPQNGSEAALRELAARLLAPPYPSDAYSAEKKPPELHIGGLPENLPVEVPIPEGTNIIGCAVHGPPRGGRLYEVVLDAEVPADRVRELYLRQLRAAGWSEQDDFPPRSGFVPRDLPRVFRFAYRFPRLRRWLRLDRREIPPLFRLGARDPKLWFGARDRNDAPTDVRLALAVEQRDHWERHEIAWTVIPSLLTPRGAWSQTGTGYVNTLLTPPGAYQIGGGSDRYESDGAYSHVVLQTVLDLDALDAHYTAQLDEAGWTRTDGDQSGPQTWSTWTTRDEKDRPWTGTFTTLRLSGTPEGASGRYLLQIHAGLTHGQSVAQTGGAE